MAGDNSAIPPGPPAGGPDLEPRQRRIMQALLAEGWAEQANLYLGALRILAQPDFPGGVRFIAHAVREIWNGTREYLDAADFRDEKDASAKRARAMFAKRDIAAVDAEHDPMLAAARQCAGVVGWFVGHAHAPRKDVESPSYSDIAEHFRLFEASLHGLLVAFYEGLDDVDRVLSEVNKEPWVCPTADQIAYAIACITKFEQYRHFFKNLLNPTWVAPLFQAGFFRNPPPPQSHEEEHTVSFPMWPESGYLARMAPHVRNDVITKIITSMPDTENWRVHEGCIDAALAMPAALAARVVPLATTWLRKPYLVLVPERLGRLMAKLASEGEPDAAFQLADELLEPVSVPRPSIVGTRQEAWPRFDPWQYEQILTDSVPELLKAHVLKAAKLLCDKLEAAIRIENADGGPETSDDFSRIWRPHIEGTSARGFGDLKSWLTEAIRDAALRVAAQDAELARRLLDDLESRRYSVFKRIALHILCELPNLDPQRTEARLSDRILLEDWWTWPEHARLMESRFGSLDAELQLQVLRWIDEGPELPADESPEEAHERLGYWQVHRLSLIRAYLDPEWQARYEVLAAEFGETRASDSVNVIAPVTATDFAQMSDDEVIGLLRSWRPLTDRRAQTPRDLKEALREAASGQSKRFAALAPAFRDDVDPTYIGGLLFGLQQACGGQDAFDWSPVIDLCDYVARRPTAHTPLSEHRFDADHDWGNAKFAVASLLSAGLRAPKDTGPSFDLRIHVWHALQPLTEHLDAPTTTTANSRAALPPAVPPDTIRAAAIEGVILYALWCLRHLRPDGTANGQSPGLPEIPEVKGVLERHIDVAHDASDRVRRMYGRHLPWLVLLDRVWVERLLPQIFPDAPALAYLRDAAWDDYITLCDPYNPLLEVLGAHYQAAVLRLKPQESDDRHVGATEEALGMHVIVFYVRGKLPLDGLLRQFFERAVVKRRAHVIGAVGRDLEADSGQFDGAALSRLRALWDFRLKATGGQKAQAVEDEFAEFGFWFASDAFEAEYSLAAFGRTLDATAGRISYWTGVCKRLAALVPVDPHSVVNCLRRMTDRDSPGWEVDGHAEEISTVLRAVLSSGDAQARNMARDLIHSLGARGIHHFRDLLDLRET